MALVVGVCKLCLETRPLLNTSHIIPDFLYEPLYDHKHRLILAQPNPESGSVEQVRSPRTAPYDGGLLCATCDNERIGSYEQYVARLLFGKGPELSPPPRIVFNPSQRGGGTLQIDDYDFRRLKLFFMSIVWRAHHSRQAFFDEVNLGPYEKVFRAHLMNGTAPVAENFPVYLIGWNDSAFPTNVVMKPARGRWAMKHPFYFLVFRGLVIYQLFPKHLEQHPLTGSMISESSSLSIPFMQREQLARLLGKYWHRPSGGKKA